MGTRAKPQENAHSPKSVAEVVLESQEAQEELRRLGYNLVDSTKEEAKPEPPPIDKMVEVLSALGLGPTIVDTAKRFLDGCSTLFRHELRTSEFDSDVHQLHNIARQARLMGRDDEAAKAMSAAIEIISKKNNPSQ